jgi:hypothetical protein
LERKRKRKRKRERERAGADLLLGDEVVPDELRLLLVELARQLRTRVSVRARHHKDIMYEMF